MAACLPGQGGMEAEQDLGCIGQGGQERSEAGQLPQPRHAALPVLGREGERGDDVLEEGLGPGMGHGAGRGPLASCGSVPITTGGNGDHATIFQAADILCEPL